MQLINFGGAQENDASFHIGENVQKILANLYFGIWLQRALAGCESSEFARIAKPEPIHFPGDLFHRPDFAFFFRQNGRFHKASEKNFAALATKSPTNPFIF